MPRKKIPNDWYMDRVRTNQIVNSAEINLRSSVRFGNMGTGVAHTVYTYKRNTRQTFFQFDISEVNGTDIVS